MNIPVVLGILVAFGFLGFRKANLFTWALAWWVGCYVLFRFGFTAPIPASVISGGDAGWTVRGKNGGSSGTFIWT